MKKQGVITISFCGREISELRTLVNDKIERLKPENQCNRMLMTYLKRILLKLSGSYQCKVCKSWIRKGLI